MSDDDETQRRRVRLRELKSTFRYDYEGEGEDEDENEDEESRSTHSGLHCPLESSFRLLGQLDFRKVRSLVALVLAALVLLGLVYACLRPSSPTPRTKTSLNVILAASNKIKFDL